MTAAPRHRTGSGWAMTGLRRAIGALRYLNEEPVRAPEAIIRSARAPQSHPRPGVPAGKDAHPVTLDALIPMGLVQSPLAVAMFDTELRSVWVNQAAERLGDGIPATGWPGRRLGEVLPCMDTGLIEQSLQRVLATGKPVVELEVSSRASGDPGGECFWNCIQFRIDGPDGETAGVAHMMREVTERVHNQHRLALADEASTRIGTTLDTTRTAEELLDVAIPRLADAGAVDLLATVIKGDQHPPYAHDQKMRLWRAAVRWPAYRPAPPEYLRHAWLETDPAKLYHQRLVAGSPVYLPAFGSMTPEQTREMESGTGFSRMMAARAAGAHSMMTIPLTARSVIMGIVVLYRLTGSEPFTRADLALARDLVSRAAVPIDNARHYTRERATALALQRGLLPRQIPDVPGLDLAYSYVPAETAAEIGGDWFDVIPLPPGRCALTVGDVTGHDMRAASLMGQLRTATRTLATLHLTPSEILTRLDQITADLTDEETGATCIYAVHDATTGDWDIARAGHPLPALARPGHSAAFLDLPPGMPLGAGVGGDGQYQTTRLHMPRDSTLVLYTDGLIESPAADISTGMARLARTLTTISKLPVKEACNTLLATLAPNPADDIAVLMARTR
jgi:Stage II sporulation protein E (SpoIIE)/PAS fold/GAF domain